MSVNDRLIHLPHGARFGRWTVQSESIHKSSRIRRFDCICDCGTQRAVLLTSLNNGASTSCGCTILKVKHGYARRGSKTREYIVWRNMISRCHDSSNKNYKYYGGRGIYVCQSWRADFGQFMRDMGPRPTEKHKLERIDNSSGYSATNCRWATHREQMRNTRANILITVDGITMTAIEWSEKNSISRDVIYSRLHRGWNPVQAVTRPLVRHAHDKTA